MQHDEDFKKRDKCLEVIAEGNATSVNMVSNVYTAQRDYVSALSAKAITIGVYGEELQYPSDDQLTAGLLHERCLKF